MSYFRLRDLKEAEASAEKGVKLLDGRRVGFEKWLSTGYTNRAGIFGATGRRERALADFTMARKINEPFKKQRPIAYSLNLTKGNAAEDLTQEAVDIRRSTKGLHPDGLAGA